MDVESNIEICKQLYEPKKRRRNTRGLERQPTNEQTDKEWDENNSLNLGSEGGTQEVWGETGGGSIANSAILTWDNVAFLVNQENTKYK